jgi:hypothetical protein
LNCHLIARSIQGTCAWRIGDGWKCYRHGDIEAGASRLEFSCDCERCLGALEEINPYAAIRKRQRLAEAEAEAEHQRLEVVATHRKVDVGPAREHLRQLLALSTVEALLSTRCALSVGARSQERVTPDVREASSRRFRTPNFEFIGVHSGSPSQGRYALSNRRGTAGWQRPRCRPPA